MKYLKDTFKYFFDKGPQLMLVAIVPALLTPFLLSPSSSLYYLGMYDNIATESFGALYTQMRALHFDFFYLGIVGLICFVFAFALLFGIIDRHMRVGEFTISFRRAKTRINYNFLTALKFIAVVAVVFEVLDLLTVSLYYLWAVAFGPGVKWLIFSTISLLLTSTLMLFAMTAIMLWPPFMLHTGYNSLDAFRIGWRQICSRLNQIAAALVVVVIPFQIAMIIAAICQGGPVVRTVLDGVCLMVILPYYVALMYNVFYDVTGTERMDLQKMDIWSKKASKY